MVRALAGALSSANVDEILRRASRVPPIGAEDGDLALRFHVPLLRECFSLDSIGGIVAKLQEHAAQQSSFARRALGLLAKQSPTSLHVTLRAIRHAASVTLDETLARDLELCRQFVRFPDFVEGIRCAMGDKKGQTPQWAPIPVHVDEWGSSGGGGGGPVFVPGDSGPVSLAVYRQIYNVWQDMEGFRCVGCAPTRGSLGLVFFAPLKPTPDHDIICDHFVSLSGYPGLAHGGLLATLIDESSYFAFNQSHQALGLTSDLTVKYSRPCRLEQWCRVEAKVVSQSKGRVTIEARVLQNGAVCASGTVVYLVLPLAKGAAALGADPSRLSKIVSSL